MLMAPEMFTCRGFPGATRVGLENAADNFAVRKHVEIIVVPLADGRLNAARFRCR
jgi:hypothetical protein